MTFSPPKFPSLLLQSSQTLNNRIVCIILDGKLYRGVILKQKMNSFELNDFSEVHLLDVGANVLVPTRELRKCPEELEEIPALAKKIKLAYVKPFDQETGIETAAKRMIYSILGQPNFSVKITRTDRGIPEALIMLDDLPLQYIMIKEGVVRIKNDKEIFDREIFKILQTEEENAQKENIGAWDFL